MSRDWSEHLDDLHDLDEYLPEYRRRQAAEARAEELALYRGPTVTVRAGRYRVERQP